MLALGALVEYAGRPTMRWTSRLPRLDARLVTADRRLGRAVAAVSSVEVITAV
jgi:hypothetical protein